MKKIKLSGYFIFISASAFIAILIAIIQKSYNHLMGPIESVESNVLLRSINPELDVGILEEIENRQEFIETGSINIVPYFDNETESTSPSLIPTTETSPVATQSASN